MWIPHFLLEFWEPETSPDPVLASERDTSERKFKVWFFLEDPPARLVQDSGLALAAPEHRTQTDGTGRSAGVRFEPNDKGRLASIAFKITTRAQEQPFGTVMTASANCFPSGRLLREPASGSLA